MIPEYFPVVQSHNPVGTKNMRDSRLIPPHRIAISLSLAYSIMGIITFLYPFHHACQAEVTDNGSTSSTTVALDREMTPKLKPVLKPLPTLVRLDPVYKDRILPPIGQEDKSTATDNTGFSDTGKKSTDTTGSHGSEESSRKIPKAVIHSVTFDDRVALLPHEEETPRDSIPLSAKSREPEFVPSDPDIPHTSYTTGMDIPLEGDDSSADPAAAGFAAERLLNDYMYLDDRELMIIKLTEFISGQNNPLLINQARLKLGRSLAESGQMDDAKHEYELILDDRGANRAMKAGAMAGMAEILSCQMNFRQALLIWTNIEKTYPEYLERAYHLVQFGLTALAADNPQLATRILNDADLLESELPEVPISMLGRALASELQGDPKTSRLILRNLVKRYPDSREADHARIRLKDLNMPILPGSQGRRKVDSK